MFKEDMGMNDNMVKGVGKGLSDTMRLTGVINFKLFGPDGKLKDERTVTNTVTTVGKNATAAFLAADPATGTYFEYLAIGTGAPSATALGAEVGTRVAGTLSNPSGAIWQNVGTFVAGNGTATIAEAGLFNQLALGGTMLASQTFGAIVKEIGDSLQLTWQVTVS